MENADKTKTQAQAQSHKDIPPEKWGVAQRMQAHNEARRLTGDPRAGIRAYCAGNRWLEENARAVGNW